MNPGDTKGYILWVYRQKMTWEGAVKSHLFSIARAKLLVLIGGVKVFCCHSPLSMNYLIRLLASLDREEPLGALRPLSESCPAFSYAAKLN